MSVRQSTAASRPALSCRTHRIRTVAIATAAPTVLWIGTAGLGGVDLTVHQGGTDQNIGIAAVIVVSLLAGLAAWGSLAAVERFTKLGRRLWIPLAASALVASLMGPMSSGVGAAGILTLIGMHLLVGVTLILGLPRPASC